MRDDDWTLPATSAGDADPARGAVFDDDERDRQSFHDLLLLRLLVGIPAVLVLVFGVVVGAGAHAHAVDQSLFNTWWAYHHEYDCCVASEDACNDGVVALVELRQRLQERDGSPRAWMAKQIASGLGVSDVDVSEAPADVKEVDSIFASCPALAGR